MNAGSDDYALLADIGGTNARFALCDGAQQILAVKVLACRDYPSLAEAILAYLNLPDVRVSCVAHRLSRAALAIANPVQGDLISMTNHHWRFSQQALARQFDWQHLLVLNDFSALAMSLPYLQPHQRVEIVPGQAQARAPIALLGSGTGLGVSGLIPRDHGGGWQALASEGGHCSFAPANAQEMAILDALWQDFGHASAERLLSGSGLEWLYQHFSGAHLSAAEISARALAGSCAQSRQTVLSFCSILGGVAGNLALTLGAHGGVYIGGGIVPRFQQLLQQSEFSLRFSAKGRLRSYLQSIPCYLITADHPALFGAAMALQQQQQCAELLKT